MRPPMYTVPMPTAIPTVAYERIALATLIPADYNPREISPEALEGLKNSIIHNGLVQPLVVNRRTGHVIGGHQRLVALLELGVHEEMVGFVDLDLAHEKALNLALNNRQIEGDWVPEKVGIILEELREVLPESLDLFRLRELGHDLGVLKSALGGGDRPDVDDTPIIDESRPAISEIGDLYLLGEHMLLCGDSLDPACVDRLMGGETAQMIFTDPPWNVNYGIDNPVETKDRPILNDHMDTAKWHEWLEQMSVQLIRITDVGAHIYLVMGTASWPETHASLVKSGFRWSSTIAWVKDTFVMSPADYHQRWEAIWYGWKAGKARRCPLLDRTQDNVWEFARPKASPYHPHTKPVALIEKALENSSLKGDVVVDLFGGSGSTLIACETSGRRCRTMELDPKYADVIVQRFVDFAGIDAVQIKPDGSRRQWGSIKAEQAGVPDPALIAGLAD